MTPQQKKKRIVALVVAVLAVLLIAVHSCQSWSHKQDQSQTSSSTKKAPGKDTDKSAFATLSIDNGASQANSNYAVNGLHVYDPTTEDKDDFVDGAEIEKGTQLSIYVYNLASAVHLYIEHDGKVIADKDYSVLKSDEDVEFFDFEVKGDVKVVTTVVNAKANQKRASVFINDDTLASLQVDGKDTATGSDIGFGQHDLTVTAGKKDITSTITVGEKAEKSVIIKAGASYTYKDVSVKDNVFVHYEYAQKADRDEAQNGQSASTTGSGNAAPLQVSNPKDGYTVHINNQTSEQLDIRYLDDQMQVHDIVSGSRYKTGLAVYSRVVNKSDRSLRLTATLNGSVVDATTIKPKPFYDDATYFGLESIELTGDLVFTLTYADGGTGASTDPSTSPSTSNSQPPSSTTNPSQTQPSGANPTSPSTPTNPTTPTKRTGTITIQDGAKAANSDIAVNGLHVYSPGYHDSDNFKSGDQVALGTPITIYAYNLASDIHLTVVHNGKVIVDKDYGILKSDSDVDFIEFTLEGDVTVTTSVGKKGTKPVTPTPSAPSEQTYTVLIENQVPKATVNTSYVDTSSGTPKAVKIASGSKVKKGTGIFVQVLNPTADRLKVTAYVGKKVVGTTTVEAKASNEDYAAGALTGANFDGMPLTGDMRIVVEKLATSTSHTLTVSGAKKDQVTVSVDKKTVKSGSAISAGKHQFTVYNTDRSTAEREVTLKVNGTVIGKKVTKGDTPATFDQVTVHGAVEVIVQDVQQMATITINDGAKALNSDTAVNGLHVYSPGYNNEKNFSSGDKMPLGTKISVYEYNFASPVRIQITLNGQVIVDKVQNEVASDKDVEFFDFTLTGDVVVTTSPATRTEPAIKLHVDNAALATIYNAETYQEVTDQSTLSKGSNSFEIYSNGEAIDVVVTSNGQTLASQRIEANKSWTTPVINVSGDVTITLSKVPQPVQYSLTVTGDAKDLIAITEGSQTYVDQSLLTAGSHSFAIYNAAYDETAYDIVIKVNGQEVARGTAQEYVSFDATVEVAGAVEISATKQPVQRALRVTGAAKDKVKIYLGSQLVTDGAAIPEGTNSLYVYAADENDWTTYHVTLKKNGVVLASKEAQAFLSADFEGLVIDGDLELEVTE